MEAILNCEGTCTMAKAFGCGRWGGQLTFTFAGPELLEPPVFGKGIRRSTRPAHIYNHRKDRDD